jgi:putative membrane protein
MRLKRIFPRAAFGANAALSASATGVALIATSGPAFAYAHSWYHTGGHGGWVGMLVGPFMMILWIALAIAVVLLVLRLFGIGARKATAERTPPRQTTDTALDILRRRFAGGEIDAETFDAMKAHLAKE